MKDRITGIYVIKNTVTGKTYIGQAVDFEERKRNHLYKLRYKKHYNKALQADWDKMGSLAFKFEVIEKTSVLTLGLRERYWIDKFPDIYNVVIPQPKGAK